MKRTSNYLVMLLLVGVRTLAYADFPVAQNSYKEWLPVVAYNSSDHEYLVVWLDEGSGISGLSRVQAQRVAEDGSLVGSAFTIFGIGFNVQVAYNAAANEYLVAYNLGSGFIGQRVSNTGQLLGSVTSVMSGVSDGRLLYNSITGQYLFLGATLVETPAGSGYYNIKISSCKLGADGQALGSPLEVENTAHGYNPPEAAFGAAYAPVQSAETPYGRYLLAIGRGVKLVMLDSDGKPIDAVYDPAHPGVYYRYVPFRTGSPTGGEYNVDVAYGFQSGFSMTGPSFLVVWADQNNTYSSQSWTGIWGGFVDATKISYSTTEVIPDQSFPISAIADHWAYNNNVESWRPKAAFNPSSQKFYVVWRETPGTSPYNNTTVNHIRANYVFEKIPATNVIVSSASGTEDPTHPALAASTTSEHALVVWQDSRNISINHDLDIYGSIQKVADPVLPPVTDMVVLNTLDSGPGSLRQAMLNANAHPGKDTITFNIEGAGLHTIMPVSPLPALTDPVVIDGFTQLGSKPNTNALKDPSNATLKIVIDGSTAGSLADGIWLKGGNSCVRGLVINSFSDAAVRLDSVGGNVIEGNYLGTDNWGLVPHANVDGVWIDGVADNLIGGTTPEARNVISGNSLVGVAIHASGATGNVVQGNYIGVNANGTDALGNIGIGISIYQPARLNTIGGLTPGAGNVISGNGTSPGMAMGIQIVSSDNEVAGNIIGTNAAGDNSLPNFQIGIFVGGSRNTVGGPSPGARNIISGNALDGVELYGDTNAVQGNFIGTDAAGSKGIPNAQCGVVVAGIDNMLGGTADGAGNIIAFSVGDGIRVEPHTRPGVPVNPARNHISRNSIYANAGLGINLVGGAEDSYGVTLNDQSDADAGPNNLQNYPVISSVIGGSYISLGGALNGTPNSTFRVEFFSTPVQSPVHLGEGKTFLGYAIVTTDQTGDAPLNLTIGAPADLGQSITATASDISGNTSEFSPPFVIAMVEGAEVVTNTLDSGPGSLRQAILNANAKPGMDSITFNIPGSGIHTIQPITRLPSITDPVVIDGYTQPGSQPNTNGLQEPCNAVPLIVLDGIVTNATYLNYDVGLHIRCGGSRVRGLVMHSFGGYALHLDGAGGNVIEGNFLGTVSDGRTKASNRAGIFIDTVGYNTVGGLTPAARNIISGNQEEGIEIYGNHADHNLIQGNFIGVDASGGTALTDSGYGILIRDGYANTIGGSLPGAGNVMARNVGGNLGEASCIGIFGSSARNNIVSGNLIGVTVTSNTDYGVFIGDSANANRIGGTSTGARNVISRFGFTAVVIRSDSNIIQGNYIGTDITGTEARPCLHGMGISGSGNQIGGRSPGAGNVISGNYKWGLAIGSAKGKPDLRHNIIEGNRIGTQADGASPLGNVWGLGLFERTFDTEIGDTAVGAGNIIAFNDVGVTLGDNSSDYPINNHISGNSIFGNTTLGIDLVGGIEDPLHVSINDPGDWDSGPNNLQNYPVLTSAWGGNSLQVHGSLNSSPNSAFTLEFFATPSEGTPKPGEGRTYLGSATVQTDASGNAPFDITLNVPLGSGSAVTATATDNLNNTSEFSLPVLITSTHVAPNAGIPDATALLQNYPNPFNPTTVINYQLAVAGKVRLVVFNTLGQVVRQLVDGEKNAGYHKVEFDATGCASGVYFYRLQVHPLSEGALTGNPTRGGMDDFTATRKLLLLR